MEFNNEAINGELSLWMKWRTKQSTDCAASQGKHQQIISSFEWFVVFAALSLGGLWAASGQWLRPREDKQQQEKGREGMNEAEEINNERKREQEWKKAINEMKWN